MRNWEQIFWDDNKNQNKHLQIYSDSSCFPIASFRIYCGGYLCLKLCIYCLKLKSIKIFFFITANWNTIMKKMLQRRMGIMVCESKYTHIYIYIYIYQPF